MRNVGKQSEQKEYVAEAKEEAKKDVIQLDDETMDYLVAHLVSK